ncbi:MAG: NAD-dependent epimerase/dehydratase family protein [Pseudomonadales bacterium]|jgi:nucleoside-diphosphate-sugar epimerase|nr:NAD-dependent epimerase/dehydratase family protein [Pseudomonadales bacterium]MDP6470616.1 NAD-dependent epimerase/dehydratase family protein [Pseudomonadales bacterium]MDP6828529.1 NAD-dependent epimerase/dehydratase family protein [Pseudomonadales bacterium]MDP6973136.1 NAD-dependent epimerase/dehydratase family protein [Pseudomonadales bacterium]|tara:strand:- start:34 stop:1095 length:1062 start_codon:yes stop_codon:yes gene_type:complete
MIKVLVLGGLGLVGRAVVECYVEKGAEVLAVSRRSPDFETAARFASVDLQDRAACERTFAVDEFTGVTHIVYAALQERSDLIAGWQDDRQIAENTAMLRNVLDHVSPSEHFTLLQGTKAYGAHVGPMRLPGKESAPRHAGGNFYWNQEDLVRERAARDGFAFSIMRPQIVFGIAIASPMNMALALGVYACVLRARGEPLHFPGGGQFVTEATDARLLARAIEWAGNTARCAGETYNVTNGDVLEWRALWPAIAEHFAMPPGEDRRELLALSMPEHAGDWMHLARTHGLRIEGMADLVGSSWQFADAVLGAGGGQSTLLSTIKIRQHGFGECIDTESMLLGYFRQLQRLRLLPS